MLNKNVFLVSLIFFAILSRFLPHPPNFTPIAAIALLSSKGFNNRWVVFLIPIVSLFISDLFINKLELDDEGYLKVKNHVFTSKKGVFAAGDVHDKTFRQAVTAAGFGCMAALEAEKFTELKE